MLVVSMDILNNTDTKQLSNAAGSRQQLGVSPETENNTKTKKSQQAAAWSVDRDSE